MKRNYQFITLVLLTVAYYSSIFLSCTCWSVWSNVIQKSVFRLQNFGPVFLLLINISWASMEKLLLDFLGAVTGSLPDFPSKHQHSSTSYGFVQRDVWCFGCFLSCVLGFFVCMCWMKDDCYFATRCVSTSLN